MEGIPKLARAAILSGDDLKMTRADLDRIPYATLAVRMGKGSQILTVLSGIEGTQLDWVSGAHEVVATRYGRVVKTVGMPQSLKETSFLTPDPLALRTMVPGTAYTCSRTIDIEPLDRYGIVVDSRFDYVGRETIAIFGHSYVTDAWRESCFSQQLDWSFKNRYWRDVETGLAWKSVQQVTPDLPAMELLVTRRAPDV